jgi:hypothetical protein
VTDFPRDVAIPYDRPSNKLREHQDVEHIVRQTIHGRIVVPIDINDVSDGLEGEKGDANGKQHFRESERFQSKEVE